MARLGGPYYFFRQNPQAICIVENVGLSAPKDIEINPPSDFEFGTLPRSKDAVVDLCIDDYLGAQCVRSFFGPT